MRATLPIFKTETTELVKLLKTKSCDELMTSMKISSELAELNKQRFKDFCLDTDGVPALLAYDGIQYKALGAEKFKAEDWEYANRHLRILDALYGVLKPLDSLRPYRLEMKNKIHLEHSLYNFWGDKLYKELCCDNDFPIVNLASGEYSKAIEKHLCAPEEMITCTFKVVKNNVAKVESTQAKRARGLMAAFAIRNKLNVAANLKAFDVEGYAFDEACSTNRNFIFIKN